MSPQLPWTAVPSLVASRYKTGEALAHALTEHFPDYNFAAYWQPDLGRLLVQDFDGNGVKLAADCRYLATKLPGVKTAAVRAGKAISPATTIRVKLGSMSWLTAPHRWAGKFTGGPSPLSNAVVNSMLGAGLGYGGGWLASKFLPDSAFDSKETPKKFALLGGLAGFAPSVADYAMNLQLSKNRNNEQGISGRNWLKSFLGKEYNPVASYEVPNSKIRMAQSRPKEASAHDLILELLQQGVEECDANSPLFVKACDTLIKKAVGNALGPGRGPVPVDAFNRAIWNDVHNGSRSSMVNPYGTRSPFSPGSVEAHTPPAVAASMSGVVTGVQQMHGGAGLLSPRHFISGLAAAGVDGLTAKVVGAGLGSLGGLRPEAQDKLQQMGLWGGMMRGMANSLFSR